MVLVTGSFQGRRALVRSMLERGGDVNFVTDSDFTALYTASQEGHFEIWGRSCCCRKCCELCLQGLSFHQDGKTITHTTRPLLPIFVRLACGISASACLLGLVASVAVATAVTAALIPASARAPASHEEAELAA